MASDSLALVIQGVGGSASSFPGSTSTTNFPPRSVKVDGRVTTLEHGCEIRTQNRAAHPLVLASLHLKDRVFHPNKPAELRRAEARKWSSVLKPWLSHTNDLVVVVEAFDEVDSAPVRALADTERSGIGLALLRPTDLGGQAWTHHDPATDSYHRWTFVLASTGAVARLRSSRLAPAPTNGVPRAVVLEFAP